MSQRTPLNMNKTIAQIDCGTYEALTGPLQVGNDWPGVFLRGDDALLVFAPLLRDAAQALSAPDGPGAGEFCGFASQLLELRRLLNSCALRGVEREAMLKHKS